MRRFKNTIPGPLFTTVTLALSPIIANASGFALLEQSASRLGTAFAGTTVAADDATTNFFNPAGLVYLERPELIALGSGIKLKSEFKNEASQPALGQPLGDEGGDAGAWNFVPGAYFAMPINDAWAFGIGFNGPFGLVTDYDAGWIGRFQADKSDIKTININPSIAWQVTPAFSVGVGVSYQTIDAELTNAVNYTAAIGSVAPAAVPANLGLEGQARVEGDDESWGFNVGLLFDLSETTRIGLAYRGKVEYELTGDVTFTPPTATNPVGAAIIAGASAPGARLSNGPVSVDVELPDIATASLMQKIGENFTLFADIAWTGWSSVQELRVVRDTGVDVSNTPEKWEDTMRYAIGGAYELSDALTLRAGVALDESSVPDSTRTARLPDTERTWVAIGARWRPSESIVLDFGYAHLFSDDVPLNQNAGNSLASAFQIGEQESTIDIVTAQLIYRF
jgi:long-chain fatty acid transport protein